MKYTDLNHKSRNLGTSLRNSHIFRGWDHKLSIDRIEWFVRTLWERIQDLDNQQSAHYRIPVQDRLSMSW